MKRFHRRVQNSEQMKTKESDKGNGNTLGSLTFDRRTFVECSSRMMRLVPTLNRRQNNVSSISTLPTFQGQREIISFASDNEDDQSESEPCPEKTDASLKPRTSTSTSLAGQKSSSPKMHLMDQQTNTNKDKIDIGGAVATLPRSTTNGTSISGPGSSATLPASLTPPPKEKQPFSRKKWLKPITSLVGFFSKIGDNIHITSYPTH